VGEGAVKCTKSMTLSNVLHVLFFSVSMLYVEYRKRNQLVTLYLIISYFIFFSIVILL
jgi:hypothetical protein